MADDKSGILDSVKETFSKFGAEVWGSFSANFSMDNVIDAIQEVDVAATSLAKEFGQGRENVMAMKVAMADAVSESALLGKGMTEISALQGKIAEGIGRNTILSSESYPKLFALEKVVGQNAETIVKQFKDAGVSIYNVNKEMQGVIDSARAVGVNAQEVSSKVLSNMDKLNMYNFNQGVEGLAKMAAHATAMNIDMGSTFRFAEKVYNPEGAINTAAALQRLGVTQSQLLDPLRLMDLSANDPEELQKQMADLGKSFVELDEKGRFQIMPGEKRRMREIAEQLGMTAGEFSKMALASAEMENKLKTIQFPDFATEEQKQFIANMAEMKDGKYVIQTETGPTDVTEVLKGLPDQKAFEKFIEASKPKDIQEIAEEQLTYTEQIRNSLAAMEKRLPMAIAASKTGTDAIELGVGAYKAVGAATTGLKQSEIRTNFDENSQNILKTLNDAVNGKAGVSDVLGVLGKAASSTKDLLEKGFQKGLENAQESMNKVATENNQLATLLSSVYNKISPTTENKATNEVMVNQMTTQDNKTLNIPTATQNTTPMTDMPNTSTQNSNISMNITLTAPPNIDTAQLDKVLKDPAFQQKLVEAVNAAMTNQNQTPQFGNKK
jgi:hypothetical protein